MDIKTIILGFLDWKDLTGYELKKIFSSLDFLPWAGNNNQIYTKLISLKKSEYVTSETILQENTPPKKVYSITTKGVKYLEEKIKMNPDFLGIQNDFLLHLLWADKLTKNELKNLISNYEEKVISQLHLLRENYERKEVNPARTKKEKYIWDMIRQNKITHVKAELDWLTKLKSGLDNK